MTDQQATLRIVAGKGGVGRTTVAAALAATAASQGKRVLAVDAVGTGALDRLVSGTDSAGSATSGPVGDGAFQVLRLTTRAALDDYLKIYLRLPLSPSRLGPLSRIFDYVSAAAPGVRELLVIGKIGWEVRNGGWDEVIVDGPATGHAVELLRAPQSMAELVPTGPIAEQTGWLQDVLEAPTTGVVLVTVPEELAVTETGELLARITDETATAVSGLLVNRMPPRLDADGMAEAERRVGEAPPVGPVMALVASRDRVTSAQLGRLATYGLPTAFADEVTEQPVDAVVAGLGPWPGFEQ